MMDYLDGSVTDLAAIQYHTGLPRLHLVPSGTPRETTGEYFSSSRMRMMIDSLRGTQSNRYLILDSPPTLDSPDARRSEEHTSELQSLMRTSYAVFCLKKKKHTN